MGLVSPELERLLLLSSDDAPTTRGSHECRLVSEGSTDTRVSRDWGLALLLMVCEGVRVCDTRVGQSHRLT